MNTETLKKIFQSPFNYPIYSREIVHSLFGCNDVLTQPELIDTSSLGDSSHYVGQMEDAEGRLLGFFYTRVAEGSDVRRKRVGLRKLIQPYLRYEVDAAIAVFDDGQHWRLSYICDHKEGTTSAKRFSYVLGDRQGQYKTPLERLDKVAAKAGRFKMEDLRDAFSVDALSKEFFDEYHRHYDRILRTTVELISKDPTLYSGLSKLFADYIKKMMGRIVFLHFLQKKGWLNGDQEFLKNLFFMQPLDRREDFLEQVLEPLFFGIFNTEPQNREKLFRDEGWDVQLLEQWKGLPYLNGGLFERDVMDTAKLKLPASLFERLFDFMASYNFTVDENDPDDADIGVDPEMLGKIFESLLEDNKAKGAFYTPKEIVRYMCKESLIAYLETQATGLSKEPGAQATSLSKEPEVKATSLSKESGVKAAGLSKEPGVQATSLSKEPGVQATGLSKKPGVQATSLSKESGVKATGLSKEPGVQATSLSKEPGVQATSLSKESGVKATSLSKEPGVKATSLSKESGVKATSLSKESGVKSTALSDYIRKFVEQHEFPEELEPYREVLDTALRNVKICDPAIGSGAFPMGLLNELWRCREALEERAAYPSQMGTQAQGLSQAGSLYSKEGQAGSLNPYSRAALKREIIENNIYGVDIERGAIDIARLRFWLSIVVDAEKPEPLPNFDYKFMQGNSLIESYKGFDLSRISNRLPGGQSKSIQLLLGLDSDHSRKNLQRLMRDYFSVTDHKQKDSMRQAINDAVKQLITDFIGGTNDELKSLNPSANKDFFLWHTWFKDIFDNGGFDIVIGNPPYVVLAGEDDLNILYKRFYLTANDGKTNLYKLFYEQGLKLLTQNGVLSFITPNTYLTGKDSKALRGLFFKTTSLREIIEYTEKDKVFENVTQAVTTLILTKPAKTDNKVKIHTYKQGTAECNQSDLKKLDAIIPLDNVIQTMNKQKERLTSFFKINQGEVNLSTKKEHYSTNRHNRTLPMWRGSNIGKYVPQSLPFEYCEISVSNPEYYSKERIVMQEVSNQNQPFRTKAILSPAYYICGHSTNSLTPLDKRVDLMFFLGLINSKAFNYYCDYFSYTNHITVSGIKQVPIPIVSTEQQNLISGIVEQILQTKETDINVNTAALENQIDELVYQLYNLTPEEIAVIESS